MSGGILVTYQGLLCEEVKFVRRRGYAGDLSEVKLPVSAFPTQFVWDLPLPGELAFALAGPDADVANAFSVVPLPPEELPKGVNSEGTLVIAGQRDDGTIYQIAIPRLFIVRVETDQVDDVEEISWVKFILADERLFWVRGVMERWSFFRTRADGTVAKDSLGSDGKPLTRAQVFTREVAAGLFRSPTVSNTPKRWDVPANEQFEPYAQAIRAMSDMIGETGVEDPCLRLDATIAIHDRGEGKVAFAPDGKGPNSQPLPEEFMLDLAGRGQGFVMEASYPEDYLVIVGQTKIATVALDDWEPVLVVDGAPFFLSEVLIRALTNGLFNLNTLKAWVLQPSGLQSLVGLPKDVIRLLQEQAYRYYRLPGAEEILDGQYVGAGPNAHLLPLLDRAGSVGGRRKKPSVESFSFDLRHKTSEFLRSEKSLIEAFIKLNAAKRQIQRIANSSGRFAPGTRSGALETPFETVFPATLEAAIRDGLPEQNEAEAMAAIAVRRRINQLREEFGAEAAQLYEEAMRDMATARGGSARILFDLAKDVVAALVEQIGEDEFEDISARSLEQLRAELNNKAKDAGAKIEAEASQRETRERAGVPVGGAEDVTIAYALVNLPRIEDGGARLISRDLGIIRTSGLAGHVVDVDVPSPADTVFVPCPVRVLFGAATRPRLDVAPKLSAESQTRADSAARSRARAARRREEEAAFRNEPPPAPPAPPTCKGGDNVVPTFLTDENTIYTAAFKRISVGVSEKVDISDVPLDQVTRMSRKWRELIPLVKGGTSNTEIERVLEVEGNLVSEGSPLREGGTGAIEDAIRIRLGVPRETIEAEATAERAVAEEEARANQQLVPGEGNKGALDRDAKELADQVFSRQPLVTSSKHSLADAWPIQCDGIVAGIEITTAKDQSGIPAGFTTVVTVGSNPPNAQSGTRTRGGGFIPTPQDPLDSFQREAFER